MVGCRERAAHGDKFAEVDGVIPGEQLNHVSAGAKDQFTDGSPIRLWLREQTFGFFGVRTELLANKISNPLGAGEVQIFFRTEVVGDGSDILPGLAAISRVVAFIPYSPNCASAAAISCFFACSPLIVMAGLFIAQSILNQMID